MTARLFGGEETVRNLSTLLTQRLVGLPRRHQVASPTGGRQTCIRFTFPLAA